MFIIRVLDKLSRLDDFKDLEGLGLSDFMGKENTVTVVEWADKFEDFWPEGMIWVRLEV
jgi:tRNA A37 threonylcarbamoyladenosine biosynthesis protein TsaE